jgi:hypothetical protein
MHYGSPENARIPNKMGKTMGKNRQLSFSFEDKVESPKAALDVLPQGSPSSPILFAIMAAAILEIPLPTIHPLSVFPESKRHSGRLKPAELPPPCPVQTTISYVDDVPVPLLGNNIPINTTGMALVAQNLTRIHSLNLSFSAGKTGLIHVALRCHLYVYCVYIAF